jgi:hypothetical protein
MKQNFTENDLNLMHDIKGLLMQLEGGLKLIEKSSDSVEFDEIKAEILQSVASFLKKQAGGE